MKDEEIPLTKAAFKEIFVEVMIKNGLSPKYYFDKVNLPTHPLENPEALLPLKPFWHLLNLVATDAGIPDFGAQVAQFTPWHEIGSVKPLISNSVDLEDLLQTICKVAPSQNNRLEFRLEKSESGLWFTRPGPSLVRNDVQMELYRVTSMIQLVQLAAGSSWYPEQIKLLMPKNGIVNSSHLISKSHIIFSQVDSGFQIPKFLLKLPVGLQIPVTNHESNNYDINSDFVSIIRHLIGLFICNKDCSIGEISRVTEIPVRTLQRQLSSHGTCFRTLLNQVKFSLAKDKLKYSTATITEISYQLGYSDPAHFNHAFNRWEGVSPSDYRRAKTDMNTMAEVLKFCG